MLKDRQSRELRRIPTTCPAVYLYDNVHKFGHGEMRNKKLKIEKTTLHKNGSSALLNIALEKEGEKRKKKLLQHGVFVFGHPSKYYPRPTGLNSLLSRRNMLLPLWDLVV